MKSNLNKDGSTDGNNAYQNVFIWHWWNEFAFASGQWFYFKHFVFAGTLSPSSLSHNLKCFWSSGGDGWERFPRDPGLWRRKMIEASGWSTNSWKKIASIQGSHPERMLWEEWASEVRSHLWLKYLKDDWGSLGGLEGSSLKGCNAFACKLEVEWREQFV